MSQPLRSLRFLAANAVVWLLMTVTLVLVPDTLERWLPLEMARVVGWVVATGLWMLLVEREWQRRTGPFVRYPIQMALWLSAAFVALWISDHARTDWRLGTAGHSQAQATARRAA